MSSRAEQSRGLLPEVVIGFLEQNEFLHEYRMQKLIYIADLVSELKKGHEKRITNADFKPYMYGTYSEDVRDELQDLSDRGDINCQLERKNGNITKRYSEKDRRNKSDSDRMDSKTASINKILEEVNKATFGQSNDDLGEWSKESWLYRNTEYGTEIDFDKVHRAEKEAKKELIDQFPQLKNVLSE